MDAPSGLTEEEGRELFEERPNSQGSHKGRQMRRASLLGASRQASEVIHENYRDRKKSGTFGIKARKVAAGREPGSGALVGCVTSYFNAFGVSSPSDESLLFRQK